MTNQQNSEKKFSPRVLSGVQPSGELHLGNYFGAIKQHIELQHEYPGEAFYFIANFHALTSINDREVLRKQTHDVALTYLTLGLDPEKSVFYRQSDVPQVCEIMWILSCVTGKGLLERAHSYKDKMEKGLRATMGLFTYPVLMAADILAVRATMVPVGADQEQHLEMTRDMASSFNAIFNTDLLPLPDTRLNADAVVPGVDGQKMSKSYNNTVPIFTESDELKKTVMSIKTTSIPLGDPLDPDNDTIFALYKLVSTPEDTENMRQRYLAGDVGYGHAKKELITAITKYFEAFYERRRELQSNPGMIEDILQAGARRATQEIEFTLEVMREVVGLITSNSR